jgi:hypothetical protein
MKHWKSWKVVVAARELVKAARDSAVLQVAGLSASASALALVPASPKAFSVDLTGMITFAEDIFNGLVPAFVPIWGIYLGIGVLLLVGGAIMIAAKSMGRG